MEEKLIYGRFQNLDGDVIKEFLESDIKKFEESGLIKVSSKLSEILIPGDLVKYLFRDEFYVEVVEPINIALFQTSSEYEIISVLTKEQIQKQKFTVEKWLDF